MKATIKTRVNASYYHWAHGRAPKGRGGWAFGATPSCEPEQVFWAAGLFAEARKAAIAHFTALNVPEVWVLS
ncbi:MAG: hypothetical protein AB9869_04720 [Verrucomicrobiia bacterium]